MALSNTRPIRTPLPGQERITTVSAQQRYAQRKLVLWYAFALGSAALLGVVLVLLGPSPAAIAWIILIVVLASALYNPRYGLYALCGLSMMYDSVLAPWYPFMKNLSSAESLFFLHDAAIINPAELLMAVIVVSWLGRMVITRKFEFFGGHLFLPTVAFLGFATLGFFYGMSQGGDLTIALWTYRPIVYLPLVILLVSNLIKTRVHVRQLIWSVMLGLAVSGVNGFLFVATDLQWRIASVLEIAGHSYSIFLNSMFVLLIALTYFRGSPRMRWFLLLTVPFMLVAYVANQRRAGYVAIVVALLVLGILSQWFSRRLFWSLLPPFLLIFALYVGAFWNSESPVGAIAQQVRTIVAPVEGSEEESSNLYRDLENVNIHYTIQQSPLTGVGMGRKFMIIAPMPDISFFIWWEYFTHNSVLWMWMQTGVGGFLAMLVLIGTSIALGMRNIFRSPPGQMRAIAYLAVSYILMHFTFAYVDMSWGGEGMVYLGMMFGLINAFERILAEPVLVQQQRWPWQAIPEPAPGLQQL